jgi:coenzyme F420-0:L-glutamate ligase / coenzyme F420-1:gamma-L-glutamate ligase
LKTDNSLGGSKLGDGSRTDRVEVSALRGLPAVRAGDDLAALIIAALSETVLTPLEGDVVVVAQKIVSKSEGRLMDLRGVTPSDATRRVAEEVGKDARLVELILSESVRVVRKMPGVLITEHRLGWIVANAGIDQSNLGVSEPNEHALLLPENPDLSALRLRARLVDHYGRNLGVIVNDSFGRPWRIGTVGLALGSAGLPSVIDQRGSRDLFGRPLQSTVVAFADEIAAAASLVMGQADQGQPAVLVRGLAWSDPPCPAATLVRPSHEDLFR